MIWGGSNGFFAVDEDSGLLLTTTADWRGAAAAAEGKTMLGAKAKVRVVGRAVAAAAPAHAGRTSGRRRSMRPLGTRFGLKEYKSNCRLNGDGRRWVDHLRRVDWWPTKHGMEIGSAKARDLASVHTSSSVLRSQHAF